MKITQDPKSGQILFELKYNERCNHSTEEILDALLEFTSEQAKQIYELTKAYREIVERLNELEEGKQL
jgi:hypothetical protein